MRSFLASLRTLVLPYGATSGQRLVLDGVNGRISAFDAANDETTRFDPEGLHFYDDAGDELVLAGRNEFAEPVLRVQDPASGSWVQLNVDTSLGNLPWISLKAEDSNGSIFTHIRAFLSGVAGTTWRGALALYANGAGSGGLNANLYLRGGSEDDSRPPEIAVGPESLLTVDGETWHNAALQNLWTTVGVAAFYTPGYRLYPDGRVWLRGVMANGNNAAGTTVFNLPAAYRPTERVQLPVTLNAGVALTGVIQVSEIGSATAGDVKIYGVPAGNAVGLDGLSFNLT